MKKKDFCNKANKSEIWKDHYSNKPSFCARILNLAPIKSTCGMECGGGGGG